MDWSWLNPNNWSSNTKAAVIIIAQTTAVVITELLKENTDKGKIVDVLIEQLAKNAK